MSVHLHPYTPDPTSDLCSIYFHPLDSEAVAHGMQNFHPMCKKCAKLWLRIAPICPVCKMSVANASSFFSRKERLVIWLENIGSSFKNAVYSPDAPLSFLGSMYATYLAWESKPNLFFISIGIVLGSLMGITATKFTRIKKSEAAFCTAICATYLVMRGEEFIELMIPSAL